MRQLIMLCIALGVLSSCGGPSGSPVAVGDQHGTGIESGPPGSAASAYRHAAALAQRGELAGALEALERSMRAGYPTPSDALTDDALRPLLDDSLLRPRVRDLLRANARETSITMTGPEAPGEPMILTVRVVGSRTEPPTAAEPAIVRPGVLVGIVQVDAAGYYQPWTGADDWNPRHFGFGVTDEAGAFVVRTVRPGYYAPEYNSPDEPAHMHYNIERRGTLLRASEFFFDDDPRLTGEARRRAEDEAIPIATVTRGGDGVWRADVTIPVRGLR